MCGNLLEESDLICKVCGANIEEQRRRKSDETALTGALPKEPSEASFTFSSSSDNTDAPYEAETLVTADEIETPVTVSEVETFAAPYEAETLVAADEIETPVTVGEVETFAAPYEAETFVTADEIEAFGAFDEIEIELQEAAASEIAASEIAEEIESYVSETSERRARSRGEFQWNVHQFPSFETRKTEDINFDWNTPPAAYTDANSEYNGDETRDDDDNESVTGDAEILEEFHAPREECEPARDDDTGDATAHPITEEISVSTEQTSVYISDGVWAETENYEFDITETAEPTYEADEKSDFSISDWLHAENSPSAFGNSFASKDAKHNRERFFTFDKKNEEFQRLLDKEYERLQAYDSPIINKARDMLALWDLPLGYTGKQTDPATMRWISSAFNEEAKAEAEYTDASEDTTDEKPSSFDETETESGAAQRLTEEIPRDVFLALSESGGETEITADVEPEPVMSAESESGTYVEPEPIIETGAPDIETEQGTVVEYAPEPATVQTSEINAETESYVEPKTYSLFETVIEAEPETESAAGEAFAGTEAELSISKTLDAIEKEIEEWKGRDKLSTVSKVAIIISVIFLIFTGGSAAVKRFAPHSSVDVWFDSVQLQAAATIKHGVDTIRDFFNDSEEETQRTGE
jgi:hypothetical protein